MNKELWLGIVHINQLKAPTAQEIMTDEMYKEELTEALKTCKRQGDVKKQVRKIIQKNTKKIILEQVFLTDNKNKSHLNNASIIVNVDTKAIIKNRFGKDKEEELVNMYLERYKDKIEQFRKQFG